MFYEILNATPRIIHYKLIKFLEINGFAKMNFNGVNVLVRIIDNIIYEVNEGDISTFVTDYLIKQNELLVLECFVKGIATYLNARKYQLLKTINSISDKDPKDASWTYFKNTAVKVTKDRVELIPYSALNHKIWNTRILNREFAKFQTDRGQFSDFVLKLSKSNFKRFLAIQTALGYLMHRYNNPSLCKAIILIDENISPDGTTNGGTGKTLLYKALSLCKEGISIEGKNLKETSRFKNQRIKITTDIINYDDVNRKFSLLDIYSMLTAGIIIERKGRDEISLLPEESPKIMISSNYRVNGSGGSSDNRRRYEFEVANYFDDEITPLKTYGKLFFEEWNDDEWNKFDCFMLNCVQKFLLNGLIEADPLNRIAKLENSTSSEFVKFIVANPIEEDVWIEKKDCLSIFINDFPNLQYTSSNQMTRWIKEYAKVNNLEYKERHPGSKYEFLLKCA